MELIVNKNEYLCKKLWILSTQYIDKPTAGGRLIGTGVAVSLHERPPAAAYNVVRADPAFGGYALCSHRGEILSLLTTYRMRINSRAVSQLKKDVHGILKKSFKRQ